jgi:hypothetical protein
MKQWFLPNKQMYKMNCNAFESKFRVRRALRNWASCLCPTFSEMRRHNKTIHAFRHSVFAFVLQRQDFWRFSHLKLRGNGFSSNPSCEVVRQCGLVSPPDNTQVRGNFPKNLISKSCCWREKRHILIQHKTYIITSGQPFECLASVRH